MSSMLPMSPSAGRSELGQPVAISNEVVARSIRRERVCVAVMVSLSLLVGVENLETGAALFLYPGLFSIRCLFFA